MGRRFSAQQLYTLRNNIPIDRLIEIELKIPSKISEGYFRFLCPVCGEFNTSVKPETNLARCFVCKKNFNTIDMVMLYRKVNFVESVTFLQNNYQFLSENSSNQYKIKNIPQSVSTPGLSHDIDAPFQKTDVTRPLTNLNIVKTKKNALKELIGIDQIIPDLLANISSKNPQLGTEKSQSFLIEIDKNKDIQTNLIERIQWLEQQVEQLCLQMKKIQSVMKM